MLTTGSKSPCTILNTMAENSGAGGGTPGATAVAEAPASSSLPDSGQDMASKVQAARGPNEVRALIAANRAQMTATLKQKLTPKPAEGQPAAEAAPAEAPKVAPKKPADLAAADAEETPASEETPAAEGAEAPAEETPAAEAEGGDEAGEDEGSEADGPVSPSTAKKLRLRLPEGDKLGRLTAAILQRNRDMPMEAAMAMAQKQLGIKPAAVEQAEVPKTNPDLPSTPDAVDAAIKQLRADRKKANAELNFEQASDLSDKLEDLIQHRFNLERDAERKSTQQQTSYDANFAKSEARATELYEFAGNPDSPGAKRMLEIEADLRENGDPLYESADKPLRIAQMVAAELRIAPKKKGAPAAKVATPPAAAPPKKQVLSGGGSRTTQPLVNQKPAIDAEIAAARSVGDVRKLLGKLGIPR